MKTILEHTVLAITDVIKVRNFVYLTKNGNTMLCRGILHDSTGTIIKMVSQSSGEIIPLNPEDEVYYTD